jgi:hypothetical protein
MKKFYLTFLVAIAACLQLTAQNNFFAAKGKNLQVTVTEKKMVNPIKFEVAELSYSNMKSFLATLPDEAVVKGNWNKAPIMELPMPDGSFAKFRVWESSIQEPALQAKFTEIRTYAGQGIDNPADNVRFDFNPYFGFSAQILSPNGRILIDPYAVGNTKYYAVYYNRDGALKNPFKCGTKEITERKLDEPNNIVTAACRGTQLRTYRLAQACTGEYGQLAGGTAGQTHARIVTSINRVNGVYETELSLRMVLIANNNLIEYLDPATDPYENDGSTDLDTNTPSINGVIGVANYDFGHLFCTDDNAGVAYLGSVCSSIKAGGLTGGLNPVGDFFDIDFVAHEMGHQFGAQHTMSGCGTSPANSKYEPGSGTTIMAYAGLCGTQNIQPNSDAFFQAYSFDQISDFVSTGGGSGCGVASATNNGIPVINALPNNNLSIPINTPFTLNATATDPDGDPLTYCWEGWDFNAAGGVPWNAGLTAAPNNTVPLFKARIPKATGERTFPDIRVIVAGYPTNPPSVMNGLKGEILSPVARPMKFKVTVRDNKVGGGGVASSGAGGCQTATTFQVNVVNTTNPFAVTAPNGGESWAVGSSQTVTWNTVGTENAPISVANVKITLSTDGGLTYPITIAPSTANDGTESLIIPNNVTTNARIRVEAIGNIFFDISNANFNIVTPPNGFSLGMPAANAVACPAPASLGINLTTSQIGTFANAISFTALGNPAGTTVSFSPSTVTPGNATTVTLNNTNTLTPGNYDIQVTASATGAPDVTRTLTYTVNAGTGPAITAQPANTAVCVGNTASFIVASATATSFKWQISTNGGSTYTDLLATAVYSGVNTDTLTISNTTLALSGNLYRCITSVQCGSTNSSAGLLTINSSANITTQPTSTFVCANSNTNISVVATGTGLTYQWQESTNGGTSWNNLANSTTYSGVTTSTLGFTNTPAGLNLNQYRCVISFTGACAGSINSNAVALNVYTLASVTANPTDVTSCPGNVTFTVAGTASSITYQWQESTNGGTSWNNLANSAVYSGVNTVGLTVIANNTSFNGNRYRCVVGSSVCTNTATSTSALLTVNMPPSVTAQPTNKTVCQGTTTTFATNATGTNVIYQWQVSTNGGTTFTNVSNGGVYSGATTSILSVQAIGVNGNIYRCLVSGTCTPAVNSNTATLTVTAPITITANPVNKTVCAGLNTSITAAATNTEAINYTWEVSSNGGTTWQTISNTAPYSGATTNTLAITGAALALNNNQYRMVTTNSSCVTPVLTTVSALTVNALPTIAWPTTLPAQCANFTTYALAGATPAGGTYKGPGVSGTNFNAAVAGVGTFTIWYIATNANGCTDSIAKQITVNPAPVLNLTTNPAVTRLLPGSNTTINANINLPLSFTTAWTYNGTTISNNNNAVNVDVTKLGLYSVVGTSAAGCTTAPVAINILDSASSKLFIYPNPNSGKFKVALHNAGANATTQILTIYNNIGKKVFENTYNFSVPWQNHDVDLRNRSNGVYLVVVRDRNGKQIATGKVAVY